MNYLVNAFSLNMINVNRLSLIRVREVSSNEVPKDAISAIGHADTAKVVSGILGWEVPASRVNITLKEGDSLFVAQYKGPRLPEGATELPEGATLQFLEVTLKPSCSDCFCRLEDDGYCQFLNWSVGR